MNDDQLDDLKQFIAAVVSQTEARLTDKMNALEQKMHDGFAGVGEAIETIHEQIGTLKLTSSLLSLSNKSLN